MAVRRGSSAVLAIVLQLIVIPFLITGVAHAEPILDLTFDPSTIITNGTAAVPITAQITNDTASPVTLGEDTIFGGLNFAPGGTLLPETGPSFYQYPEPPFPGPVFPTIADKTLNPGNSIEFNFGSILPAPPGLYSETFSFTGTNFQTTSAILQVQAPSCAAILNGAVSFPDLSNPSLLGVGLPTTIMARFVPNFGYSLAAAAAACNVANFDWVQKFTHIPDPSPLYEINPDGAPIQLTSNYPPGNDPPPNGETYFHQFPNDWDINPYPYYWDTDPNRNTIAGTLVYHESSYSGYDCQGYASGTCLDFFDHPSDPCLFGGAGNHLPICEYSEAALGEYLGFSTELVGVGFDGNPVDFGIGFDWTDSFNDISGGIATSFTFEDTPAADGSGGITVTSFDNTVNVAEPPALLFWIPGIIFIIIRNRMVCYRPKM